MSKNLNSYSYANKYITVEDAIVYICEVIYPNMDRTRARKNVRQRICQGSLDGELRILRRKGGDKTLALDFFTWAAERKGWARLYGIPELPIRPFTGSSNVSFPALSLVAFGVSIPPNRQELEQQFTDVHTKLFHAKREIERLRQENATLYAQITERRARAAQISKKNSDNAKRPRNQ